MMWGLNPGPLLFTTNPGFAMGSDCILVPCKLYHTWNRILYHSVPDQDLVCTDEIHDPGYYDSLYRRIF